MERSIADVLRTALDGFHLRRPFGIKLGSEKAVHSIFDLDVNPEVFGRETIDYIRLDNLVKGKVKTPLCSFSLDDNGWVQFGKLHCQRGLSSPPADPHCDYRFCIACKAHETIPPTVLITIADIKTEPSDFETETAYDSLIGHFNYYVMTKELYQTAKLMECIPPGVGVIALHRNGLKLRKHAMYREIPRIYQSALLRAFGEHRKKGVGAVED